MSRIQSMASLSVSQAARQLGVSVARVHQRIQDGSLPAERVGHQWVIDAADLARASQNPSGRPLSPRSAWQLGSVAAGADADLRSDQRSRARARLREFASLVESVDEREEGVVAAALASLLRRRAERHVLQAARPDLADLLRDARLVPSGVSAPGAELSATGIVEGYVPRSDLEQLIADYLLVPGGRQANVILHVVPESAEADLVHGSVPALFIAADLADHHGPREQVAALRIVRTALFHWEERQ